jgi:DNA-binding NarL/FixJ family response regulator
VLTVLVADDHAVVRQGLKQIVADAFPSVAFGEAGDVPATLDLVRRQAWDLVVLDLTMPGGNGLEAIKEMRRHRPATPVLVLSMHPEDQFAVRVLRAGAAGYLTKETAPEALVQAIRTTLAGRKYVTPSVAERLAEAVDTSAGGPPHAILSDREYSVLCRIAAGRTVSEIAEQLLLSVKTVSTYRARILDKMGLRTNAELMRYAMEHGLVR